MNLIKKLKEIDGHFKNISHEELEAGLIRAGLERIEQQEKTDRDKMLEYACDLRSDLKYAFEQGEGQIPTHIDVIVMNWLIKQTEMLQKVKELINDEHINKE